MIDEDFYDPTIIGFGLVIDPLQNGDVKDQLVSSVRNLESDDRCYMHHQRSDFILTSAGNAVKSIADWRPTAGHLLNLGKDMQQTMIVLANESEELVKHMFVVLDNYQSEWDHDVSKSLNMNVKLGCGIKFHFCNMSKKPFKPLKEIVSDFKDASYNQFDESKKLHNFIVSKFRNDEKSKQDKQS